MKILVHASLFSLLGVMVGCVLFVAKETRYLKSAQDRATQEEVRNQLGSPRFTESGRLGESTWIYEVREEDPGSRWTSTGLWCDEYVLTFDSQSVLRRWTHQSHFHGGERMPTYCVPEGHKSNS